MQNFFISEIAKTNSIQTWQVAKTLELLQSGGTVPFISRYRKDATGNLDEVQIDTIHVEYARLEQVSKRKITIIEAIKSSDKLTPDLQQQIESCWNEKLLEDIYLPYKTRRKTKADIAIENGLEPLAKILMAQNNESLELAAVRFKNKNITTVDDALSGARDIAAQWISERTFIRERLRQLFQKSSMVTSKLVKSKEEEAEKFSDYFDYSEPLTKIKSHRTLALFRGANEGLLKVKIEPDKKSAIDIIEKSVIKTATPNDHLLEAIKDSYKRLIKPSLENEVSKEIKQKADDEAIKVFAQNLQQLLLQPPLGSYRVLAIDPGFRSGCKVVCLDSNGDLLQNETIFPHPPQKETGMAMKKISTIVEQYKIEAIAIGNGTASRETESFIKSIHFDRTVKVFVVNEAGASIYSASKVAREEFPQYDVTVRGAVSIGRRLMDPLAELVKIDPKSIGVGQYQHDVDQKNLQENLDKVVISCVNKIGVDLNTASKYLLTYISGIGPSLAENIIKHRSEIGQFNSRKELMNVPKLGQKAFEQSAGFLRVRDAENVLDNTSIHPESYPTVIKMAKSVGAKLEDIIGNEEILNKIDISKFKDESIGTLTLTDIISDLKKPGHDPRKMVKVFEFDKTIRNIDHLEIGKELPGIVNNVTNFGAFVDIGIKENGLIHISNLADEYISNPADVISLHQHVMVQVISIDKERKRIGLKLV